VTRNSMVTRYWRLSGDEMAAATQHKWNTVRFETLSGASSQNQAKHNAR